MKKLMLCSLALLFCVSLVYAAPAEMAGFTVYPKTKMHSRGNSYSTNVTVAADTNTVVWTPANDHKIVLMGVKFNSDTATRMMLTNTTSAIIPEQDITASGQVVIFGNTPIWKGIENETIAYNSTTTTGAHSVLLWGYESSN